MSVNDNSRSRYPSRGRASSPRSLKVERFLLPNGLAVVLCPRLNLAQAHVAVYFGVGSRHETAANNGITHFLEHMLFRGTRHFKDALAMNAAAEAMGGFLDGATYRDHVSFSTSCHPSAAGAAVDILGELVQTPRYRAVETERAILREELLESLDGEGRMVDVDNLAHQTIFGAHGLALPIEGTLATLQSIDCAALEAHRRRYLVAHNGVIAVCGNFNVDRVSRAIESAFAGLPAGQAPVMQMAAAADPEPRLKYVRDASSQVDIRISFRAPVVEEPDYPAATMLSRVLADGSASRMHADLVDRRGLAYVLHAGLSTYADCGLFEFDVTVAPKRAAEAVAAILDFASQAGRFRFTKAEIERAQRRFVYQQQFMEDSPADLAGWHGRATLFAVENELQALGRKIKAVSADDLRQCARRIFCRRGMVLTAVGQLARGQWKAIENIVRNGFCT